ncbi:hypothetical protein ACWNX2_00295 [Candidatus Vidania fulgoroideorum]
MKLKYIKKLKGKIIKIFLLNKAKNNFKVKTLIGRIIRKKHKYTHNFIELTTKVGKEEIAIKLNTLNPTIIWTEIQ